MALERGRQGVLEGGQLAGEPGDMWLDRAEAIVLGRQHRAHLPRLVRRTDGNIEAGWGAINTNKTGLRGHRNFLDARPTLIRALSPWQLCRLLQRRT